MKETKNDLRKEIRKLRIQRAVVAGVAIAGITGCVILYKSNLDLSGCIEELESRVENLLKRNKTLYLKNKSLNEECNELCDANWDLNRTLASYGI